MFAHVRTDNVYAKISEQIKKKIKTTATATRSSRKTYARKAYADLNPKNKNKNNSELAQRINWIYPKVAL